MGTVVSFDVRSSDRDAALSGIAQACARLHEDEGIFTTWEPESPMSRVRRGLLTPDDAPPEIGEVLALCREAVVASGGWFDPWRMPGGVDPTGLVKGWSARRAAALLRTAGAEAAMVNAGGDIATFGRPDPDRAWNVGVRDPQRADRLICVAVLEGGNAALATSGTYERGAHVIDPFTGRPAEGLLSATVVGPDLAMADALATGLLAAGEAGLAFVDALPDYEAWVIRPDHRSGASRAFPLAG